MTFDTCNKRVCTKVDIKDDCYVEDSETFTIKVEVVKTEKVHNELLIEPSERLIIIEDSDGMCSYRNITTDIIRCMCVCIIICGFVILSICICNCASCKLLFSITVCHYPLQCFSSLFSRDHGWV